MEPKELIYNVFTTFTRISHLSKQNLMMRTFGVTPIKQSKD